MSDLATKDYVNYLMAHYPMGDVSYDADFTKVEAPPEGKRGCRGIEGNPDSDNFYVTFYEDGAWGRPVIFATTRSAEPMRTGFTVKRMFGPGQKCLVLVETESESEALDAYTKEFGPVVSNTTVLTEKIKFRTVPEFHEAPWVSLVWAPAQGKTP